MKWAFLLVLAIAVPPLGWWLRRSPKVRLHAWTLVGLLPFLWAHDFALLSFGSRPGDTNGYEVEPIDFLVLSLLIAEKGRPRPLPYRIPIALYALAAAVSAVQAQWTLGAFGYLWKLGRMVFLYAVVVRACQDRKVPGAILQGLMIGIVYEFGWSLYQHFVLGAERATGTFAHQNTLGMLVNLAVMVPIALLVAGSATLLIVLAPLLAFPIDVLTISRGTLLFLLVGGVLAYLLSTVRRFDARKAKLGLLGVALAAVVIPVAIAVLSARPAEEREGSMQLREQYVTAAATMLREHPLGVGPNHFTVMLLSGGYGNRAKIDWSQQVAIVHNIYWLTLAEMGYMGLAALLLLFLSPLVTAVRSAFRARADRRGDVLLGLAVALAVFYLHSLFEWAWRITPVTYVYWMIVGMIAALARQLQDERLGRTAVRGGAGMSSHHQPPAGGQTAYSNGAFHPARS